MQGYNFRRLELYFIYSSLTYTHLDGSHSNQAALNSQHRAVCGRLGAAAQQTGTIQLQYMHPLTPDLNQAAHLVRSTKGVPDAFRPLGQFPAIWTTKSFNYLNDIRKSWCNEVSGSRCVDCDLACS